MVSTLALLPNGMQQFADANGVPFLAGTVNMWVPNTETPKDNWQDKDHLALNSDPITLDAAGRCIIWGEGIYRQVLKDLNGNTVWDQLTSFEQGSTSTVTTLYDLPIFWEGVPIAGEVFPIYVAPRPLSLPASLTASRFRIETNPAATMTFTFKKNGVLVGTVAFSTGGVPTVTFAAPVSFVAGDTFSVTAPAIADTTGAGISMTFVFTAT